jgi:hypothetical protein
MNHKQSLDIQVSTIEQVIDATLDVQQVQCVGLVGLAVAEVNNMLIIDLLRADVKTLGHY